MIRVLFTILAGLLGLAFGSFLNVCLSRWPEGGSVVTPRSHCRNCGRTLAWWENVPLVSWIALRGRCRTCKVGISWRYPAVELAIGGLWAVTCWRLFWQVSELNPFWRYFTEQVYNHIGQAAGTCLLYWLLVALAILDAQDLWLPNWLTYPGILFAFASSLVYGIADNRYSYNPYPSAENFAIRIFIESLVATIAAAGLILLIRWAYWLIRRREGIGLGDAKLMAMLGAWLGLSGALLSFGIGVVLGALFSLVVLAIPSTRRESDTWLAAKLPLGTFLCIGGIISALWGSPIIEAYKRWAGL